MKLTTGQHVIHRKDNRIGTVESHRKTDKLCFYPVRVHFRHTEITPEGNTIIDDWKYFTRDGKLLIGDKKPTILPFLKLKPQRN